MKIGVVAITAGMLAATVLSGVAEARPGDRHGARYNDHRDWRAGHRMAMNDWRRGQRVDWRRHHLRAPPRGYEWRQVDGRYVLAAVATGLIASIILNSR